MRRYDVWLDGQSLCEIDQSIQIVTVQENAAKLKTNTASNAKYSGSRFLSRERQSLSISIAFVVWERDETRRARIMDEILAWVRDGVLEVNYRANQRINVRYDDMPAVGSALNWTDTITVGFTAYGLPYWEDAQPTTALFSVEAGVEESRNVQPRGSAETSFLAFEIRNDGASTINAASVSLPDTSFIFAGLGLAPGKTLKVGYTIDGLLYMMIDNTSVMNKRTSASDDDLVLKQRQPNVVKVTVSGTAFVKLMARGLYL